MDERVGATVSLVSVSEDQGPPELKVLFCQTHI